MANQDREVTRLELELERASKRIRKELVLLWPSDTQHPTGTRLDKEMKTLWIKKIIIREWLKKRSWLSSHLHVKMPKRMTK